MPHQKTHSASPANASVSPRTEELVPQKPGERGKRRYGILGGTFDPPHIAHLAVAQEAYARFGLDRVWFVPTGEPPHKIGRTVSATKHRRAMLERALADDARFAFSDVELERPGPSYTVDTLHELRMRWGPDVWMCWVVGWDMLLDLPDWHDAPGVLAALDALAAAHRPGFVAEQGVLEHLEARLPGLREKLLLLPAPQLEIAATDLRQRVASGLPIRYLVPEAVQRYIEEHHLYQTLIRDEPAPPPAPGMESEVSA